MFDQGRKICHRYLYGMCPFGAICRDSHKKEDAPLCQRWVSGNCIGATGNACKFRHYYTQKDGIQNERKKLAQINSMHRFHRDAESISEDFSSPYSLKIRKQVTKHRREEFDLETGKRRSWVEEEEFEVMDLTGESPAKPQLFNLPEIRIDNAPKSEGEITDSNKCPVCKKVFKGEKGVKSHRGKKTSPCHAADKENSMKSVSDGPFKKPSLSMKRRSVSSSN